jgi:hypothetical protein
MRNCRRGRLRRARGRAYAGDGERRRGVDAGGGGTSYDADRRPCGGRARRGEMPATLRSGVQRSCSSSRAAGDGDGGSAARSTSNDALRECAAERTSFRERRVVRTRRARAQGRLVCVRVFCGSEAASVGGRHAPCWAW